MMTAFPLQKFRNFPGAPVVGTLLPIQGAQVQSLVGELGSYMPHSVAKKKKEQNLLCVTEQMA